MNKQKIKGELHKAKGKIKEVTGRAIDNEEMEREGKLEHAKGSVQESYGELKSEVKEVTE
ncbi:CsbD family protein [Lentisalinibacter orientalis]|uniref:CsbD family protein n=1 Tax=Lentisalinibacter orientalis TaxID=2992241 RepID=UPI00386EB310